MDKEPTFLAHKQKGIDGNFSQSKVFPKIPGECPCSNNDRQLNKCVLSKPYGRDKISHSFKSGTRHLEMVPTKSYPHFSSTCCRSSEHFRRSTLPLSTVEHRVDAMQENIPTDRGSLWMSSDRSLRLTPKPPTKNILFLDSRPRSCKNRSIHFQLGFQPNLPVSSISSNSQMPFKDKEIRKDKCRAILIAPVWKSRPWYPIILGVLMDRPALLPIKKDLLQLPLSNQTHPLLTDRKRNFKLAAWPVAGNPSDSIKFLKGCPKLSLHHGGRVQKSITSLPGINSIAGVKNDQLI